MINSKAYEQVQWYMKNSTLKAAATAALETEDLEFMKELVIHQFAKIKSRDEFERELASIPTPHHKAALTHMINTILKDI